jgi:hypothetical protein
MNSDYLRSYRLQADEEALSTGLHARRDMTAKRLAQARSSAGGGDYPE